MTSPLQDIHNREGPQGKLIHASARKGKHTRDTRDSRDSRDTRDSRDSRDTRDTRDSRAILC